MITLIARLLILKPTQTQAFLCNKRATLGPPPQHMSIVKCWGSQKGHIHPDSRKLILKYDDTIGYQSVGKSHEKSFSRSNSSLYTFVFYSCFEVSHSSGWATEETTAILVNFRISHQRLATASFPTCLKGMSNMWCNIQRVLQK